MNLFDTLAALPLTRAIAWTVLHFLWQGTLIAAGAGLILGLLRTKSAQARYVVCCVGLALMLITPLATLSVILSAGGTPDVLEVAAVFAQAAAPLLGSERLNAVLPWITLVWLTGFSLLQCRTLVHWTMAHRLKRTHTRPLPAAWQPTASRLCERLGVRQAVRIVESTVADVPMLIGWLAPVILVPTSALCGLTPEQLRAVLAHELAHVRRHDAAINIVQAAMESLLFFHPAVWWISDRMRVEREYCCDDVAVEVCGDTLCYARALSTLENMRSVPVPAVAANGGSLMNRIFRLVGTRQSAGSARGQSLTPLLGATSLLALFAAAGIALASGPGTPVADSSGPETYRLASSGGEEPPVASDDEARILREIADRRQALERLQIELEQRRGTRAAERDARSLQREELAAAVAAARAAEIQIELGRGQQQSAQAAYEAALRERERLDRERAVLDDESTQRELVLRDEYLERVQEQHFRAQSQLQRSLELGQQQSDAAQRDAQRSLQEALDLHRSSAEEQQRSARRTLRELQQRSEQEHSRQSLQEDLPRQLADREAVVHELRRELEREHLRLEATLRELKRLEAGESKSGKSEKIDKLELELDAAEEKLRLKRLKENAKRNKKNEEIY